jgi:hypothetical protein
MRKIILPPHLMRQPAAVPAPALPPPPADERHHRFALLVLEGKYYFDAYQLAGFDCKRSTAYVNGHRLANRPDVKAFLSAMRKRSHEIWKASLSS